MRLDRPFAVDRLAQRIDDSSQQRLADRNRCDTAGAADFVAFFNAFVGAHDDDADVVLFQIQRDPLQAVGKFHEFRGADAAQSVNARQVRPDLDDRADFVFLHAGRKRGDLLF